MYDGIRGCWILHNGIHFAATREGEKALEIYLLPSFFGTKLVFFLRCPKCSFKNCFEYQRMDDTYKAAWQRHPQTGKLTSQNEAMVMAMVENARSSSARENLENVSIAQEQFMRGSQAGEPVFLRRIMTRASEFVHKSDEVSLKL